MVFHKRNSEILEKSFPVIKHLPDECYEIQTYKLKEGQKELKIKMKVECDYSSDTGFKTENPIEKEVIILFKKNNTEILEKKNQWIDIT